MVQMPPPLPPILLGRYLKKCLQWLHTNFSDLVSSSKDPNDENWIRIQLLVQTRPKIHEFGLKGLYSIVFSNLLLLGNGIFLHGRSNALRKCEMEQFTFGN